MIKLRNHIPIGTLTGQKKLVLEKINSNNKQEIQIKTQNNNCISTTNQEQRLNKIQILRFFILQSNYQDIFLFCTASKK